MSTFERDTDAMAMRRIVLMRHGAADWDANLERDFDRPLAERGRHDVPRMARWLQGEKFGPARVVSSPAARARDTAVLACDVLGLDPEYIVWEEGLYGASVAEVEAVVEAHRDGPPVLVIGHNPGLDEFLVATCGDAALTAHGKLLTTSATAVVDVPDDGPMTGRSHLVAIRRPEDQ